ncbi:MAG: amidohydrolase family protein [Candidatus Zixiibacteriota bacterium]|nr:MAG: amidohydrolase family protein [candidate division Zixibacteria bacterium]
MKTKFILMVLLLLFFSSNSSAWMLAIKGGRIFTMSEGIIEDGVILIENNRISEVGRDVEIPEGTTVLDASGKIVTPGLFDAFTQIGLKEISEEESTVDVSEKSEPLTPQVRSIDAFNSQSELIPVARIEGVTTILSAPTTDNVIAGQSAVLELAGENVNEMILKAPAALHINFGEKPTSTWRERKKIDTRMGVVAKIRQKFIEAEDYAAEWTKFESEMQEYIDNMNRKKGKKDLEEPEPPERDLGLEIMVQALNGEIPVIASANRKDDILTAINISEEFGLKLILLYGTDAYKVAHILEKKNIPVLVGPITTQPSKMEKLGAIYENAAILDRAGVRIAIITSGSHDVRDLRFQAGIAAQYGLPISAALKAITICPAQILGVDNDIGSIEPGKLANIAIFDGDPLQPLTKVTDVIIEGRMVPMESMQTRLYEEYR